MLSVTNVVGHYSEYLYASCPDALLTALLAGQVGSLFKVNPRILKFIYTSDFRSRFCISLAYSYEQNSCFF